MFNNENSNNIITPLPERIMGFQGEILGIIGRNMLLGTFTPPTKTSWSGFGMFLADFSLGFDRFGGKLSRLPWIFGGGRNL